MSTNSLIIEALNINHRFHIYQFSPVRNFTRWSSKINFNIVLPLMPGSSKQSLSLQFTNQNLNIFHFPHLHL